jgi:hypothetical protein
LLLAVIFLADVRWAAYAGLLWLATEIAHSHTDIKEKAKHIFWQLLLAFFLSAPLALPLLEYTSLSTRSHMTVTDILAFSLPPARLFGLVFPDFGGFHEFMLYPGILILCLASIALLVPASRQKGKIWFWVLLASLLYSLGENLPGVAELAQLPGFSLLRVPPRALFLAGISLVVLAAYGFESLLDGLEEVEKRRSRLLLVGLTAFGLALLVGVWAVTGTFPLNFAWGAGMLLLVWLWLEMNFWRRILPRFWVIGLFVLLIIDLGVVDRSLFALRSAEIVLSEGAEVAQWLSEQAGRFRVYSPSYSIPQQTAALYGLEMASGVDPLQLESYAEYMEEATGVFRTSYSITLPPMVGLDIATANQAIVPDCMFLARLNVKYVVSSFEIQGDGWTPIEIIGGDYIYQLSAMPRACLYQLPSDEIAVSQVKWSPNHIYVSVDGPGRLILSEINYPGWQAFVDGEKTQSEELDYLFRAVQLPEGQHTIEWVFRPTSVYLGLFLFLVGVVGLVLWGRRDH